MGRCGVASAAAPALAPRGCAGTGGPWFPIQQKANRTWFSVPFLGSLQPASGFRNPSSFRGPGQAKRAVFTFQEAPQGRTRAQAPPGASRSGLNPSLPRSLGGRTGTVIQWSVRLRAAVIWSFLNERGLFLTWVPCATIYYLWEYLRVCLASGWPPLTGAVTSHSGVMDHTVAALNLLG